MLTYFKRWLIAFAMLALLSMPTLLFLFWKVQQIIVRYEMTEKLEYAQMQTIEIPASSVQWYEKDREIIVDGHMFDVKSFEQIPGKDVVRFTGLFDMEEEEIKKKVQKLLNQQEENDGDRALLLQAMGMLYCPMHQDSPLNFANHYANSVFTPYKNGSVPITDLSIPSPPPKG